MAFGDDAVLTATARTHDVVLTVSCTGMTTVSIWRESPGGSVWVRGMLGATPSSADFFFGVDPEVRNGDILYGAVVSNGTTEVYVPSALAHVDHGGDWFMPLGLIRDGRTVNVESLQKQTYAVDREVVNVLGRPDPVAVHYGRHWWSGSLVLITLYDDERIWLESVLYQTRVFVFAPREDAGYEDILYLSIGEVSAERPSALAFEDSRRWTLDIQKVAAPPADYITEPVGNTWQDVEDAAFTWAQRAASDTWRTLMGI